MEGAFFPGFLMRALHVPVVRELSTEPMGWGCLARGHRGPAFYPPAATSPAHSIPIGLCQTRLRSILIAIVNDHMREYCLPQFRMSVHAHLPDYFGVEGAGHFIQLDFGLCVITLPCILAIDKPDAANVSELHSR